jgi:hypothetical protein
MRQLAAAALAFAYAGGAMAFAPAPSALPSSRAASATSAQSMRPGNAFVAAHSRPAAMLRKGRTAAIKMAETMEGRHWPKIIQGGMGVQVCYTGNCARDKPDDWQRSVRVCWWLFLSRLDASPPNGLFMLSAA